MSGAQLRMWLQLSCFSLLNHPEAHIPWLCHSSSPVSSDLLSTCFTTVCSLCSSLPVSCYLRLLTWALRRQVSGPGSASAYSPVCLAAKGAVSCSIFTHSAPGNCRLTSSGSVVQSSRHPPLQPSVRLNLQHLLYSSDSVDLVSLSHPTNLHLISLFQHGLGIVPPSTQPSVPPSSTSPTSTLVLIPQPGSSIHQTVTSNLNLFSCCPCQCSNKSVMVALSFIVLALMFWPVSVSPHLPQLHPGLILQSLVSSVPRYQPCVIYSSLHSVCQFIALMLLYAIRCCYTSFMSRPLKKTLLNSWLCIICMCDLFLEPVELPTRQTAFCCVSTVDPVDFLPI